MFRLVSFFILGCVASLSAQVANFGSFSGNPKNENLIGTRNQKLLEEVQYTDPSGYVWKAPSGTVWDGASIPSIFWSFVGGPHDGPYRDAALIHDVACCEKAKPWKVVARMFYDAARCRETPEWQAKLMYFAVLAGGPKWPDIDPPRPDSCLDTTIKQRVSKKSAAQVGSRIQAGSLTLEEKKAVAAPFVRGGQLSTKQVDDTVADLRTRDLSREDKALIADALRVSKKVTAEEAKNAAKWIEHNNPTLEEIEAEAEKTSQEGTQQLPAN
jgi:hypothetical protein